MPVELRPKNKPTHYLARVRSIHGDTPSYKFPLTHKAEADAWHDAAKAALRNKATVPDPSLYGSVDSQKNVSARKAEWNLQEAFDHCMKHHWRDSKSSDHQYIYWKEISNYFTPTLLIKKIEIEDVVAFVDHLFQSRNIAGSSVNRYLSCLSTIWKKAYDMKKAPPRVSPWPKQKESKGRQYFYSMDDEKAIFKACNALMDYEMRDYLILLCDTGMRRGEVESIDATHFLHDDAITLHDGETKNDRGRSIPLTDRAVEVVQRRLAQSKGGKIFNFNRSWFRNRWNRIKEVADLPQEACMHTFRHTYATRLALTGEVTIYDIMEALGHKDIKSTLVYAKLCMEAQKRAQRSYMRSKYYCAESHLEGTELKRAVDPRSYYER